MWAGILASSCDEAGTDDSNVVFISTLKQLTILQVRLLKYSVENANKLLSSAGWPYAMDLDCSLEKLIEICQTDDTLRIDREMDHLRSLELIGGHGGGGFSPNSNKANITPTPYALNLYIRGEGFPGSAIEYWDLKTPKENESIDANKELQPTVKTPVESGNEQGTAAEL